MSRCLGFVAACVLVVSFASPASAQEAKPEGINLAVPPQYPSQPRTLTVKELRQQRGMEKARQRRARIERNAWMGHHPLRPTSTDMPFMRSNYIYPHQIISIFPIYVR